jgi:hypothetical protein
MESAQNCSNPMWIDFYSNCRKLLRANFVQAAFSRHRDTSQVVFLTAAFVQMKSFSTIKIILRGTPQMLQQRPRATGVEYKEGGRAESAGCGG